MVVCGCVPGPIRAMRDLVVASASADGVFGSECGRVNDCSSGLDVREKRS